MEKSVKRIMPIFILLLLLVQTSCSPAMPGGEAQSAGGALPAEVAATPSPDESGEGVAAKNATVYFIPRYILQGGPAYFDGIKHAAAESFEGTLQYKGLTTPETARSAQQQIEILRSAVAEKVDAIIIAPADGTLLAEPVAEVFRAGIPIIVIDGEIDTDEYTARFYTDEVKTGTAAAEEMLKNMRRNGLSENEKAQVGFLVLNMTNRITLSRLKGFAEYWLENAPAAWELLSDDIQEADGGILHAEELGQGLIDTYPDLKGIFSTGFDSSAGAIRAAYIKERTDIALVGFSISTEFEIVFGEGGFELSAIFPRKYYMGYDAMKLVDNILKGGTPPAETQLDYGVLVINQENKDFNDPDILYDSY